jgi:thioredoxin 1
MPVLVDFWAEWCGPCRQISATIDELSNEFKTSLKVVKINIDDNPLTPTKLGVRGIPTLMIFKGGKVASTKVGALPKSEISQWIASQI